MPLTYRINYSTLSYKLHQNRPVEASSFQVIGNFLIRGQSSRSNDNKNLILSRVRHVTYCTELHHFLISNLSVLCR